MDVNMKRCSSSVIRLCSKKHRVSKEEGCNYETLQQLPRYVTEQLLAEILIRLPYICACRYKSVCKRWNALISSDYFVSRFRNESHINPNRSSFTLLFQYNVLPWIGTEVSSSLFRAQVISTNPVMSESYKKQHVNFDFLPRFRRKSKQKHRNMTVAAQMEPIRVWTSCDDLILCTYFAKYYVVNLLTKKWIMLPPVPDNHSPRPFSMTGLLCRHDANGFRFRVIVADPHAVNASLFTVRIFCSESRQWRKLIVDWYRFKEFDSLFFIRMIPHNGMLHWVNVECKELVSLDLFSDDPHLKLSQTIKLPDGFGGLSRVGLCQGHLRVSETKATGVGGHVLRVWDLEDYQKGVWRLEHQVVPGNTSLGKFFTYMNFHPYDKDIMFVYQSERVYHFNLRTGKFEGCLRLKSERDFPSKFLRQEVMLFHQVLPTLLPPL